MANKVKSSLKLSIIIPSFNEEKRLPKRFPKAYKFLNSLNIPFELIFVNDGSKDQTEKVLKKISQGKRNIKVVSYFPNHGKGYAVKKGVEVAKGEVIGFTDADFAVNLEKLPQVLKLIEQGADVVIGDRKSKQAKLKNRPDFVRRFLSKVHTNINNFFLELGPIRDTLNGFKFFKAEVAKSLFANLTIYRWFFDLEILIKARSKKLKIIQIPVSWEEVRGSKVTYFSMIRSSLKEHITIYGHFFNLRIFSFLTLGLLILFFSPFWFNPQNLTQRNGDYSDLVWPDYFFIKDSIARYHQIPLWNPTLFSGLPEIANPQSPLIYPPNILALVLPIDYAILILILIHQLVCAFFLFKLARNFLKFNPLVSLVVAYSYIFSPFVVSKIAIGHVSMVFSILLVGPILYFTLSLIKNSGFKNLFILSLLIAGQYLNYPTIWYYTNFFGLPILFIWLYLRKQQKKILWIILALIISFVYFLPIFLIQLQAGQLITRSNLSLNDLAIPLWSFSRFVKSILIPSNFLADNEAEVWLYPGLSVLYLAFWGLLKLEKKLKILASGALLLVLILTLGNRTPIFALFSHYLPGFSYLRVVTRDYFVFILILALLAGYGLYRMKKFNQLVATLVLADLLFFSALRLYQVPSLMNYSINQDLVNLVSSSDFRYYCTDRCLSARDTLKSGVITADGYHLLILKDYRLALSEAGGFAPPEYTGNLPSYSVSEAQPKALDLGLFSVKWIISNHLLEDPNFIKVKTSGSFTLYQNLLAKNRFYFKNLPNSIFVKEDSPNQIILETAGQADSLVIADNFYPGWSAWVDGQTTLLKKEQGWARALEIPTGNHTVILKYQPFRNLLSHGS